LKRLISLHCIHLQQETSMTSFNSNGFAMPTRRNLTRSLAKAATALACAAALISPSVWAQNWPNKPVRMIVPAGAGAAPDVVARILAERLGAALGQGIVVENRPGAGGIPGMSALARSPGDGYTIGFVPAAMGTITPLVFKNPQFNPDTELLSVATVGTGPLMIATKADNGINNLADLAKYAKANPGKVNLAAPQLSSLPHLAMEMVNKQGAMGMVTVPYNAPPAAVAALLAGEVTVSADGVPGLLQHVKSGRLKALALTGAKRIPGLDIPTVAETYPGYDIVGWFQILVPVGTPAAIVERLNAEINTITANPEVVNRLADMGIYPQRDSVAGARDFFASQQRAMKKLVTELGVQPQ
jgi:tripartite-type tricarboxylate transporter receptor subunit TctC